MRAWLPSEAIPLGACSEVSGLPVARHLSAPIELSIPGSPRLASPPLRHFLPHVPALDSQHPAGPLPSPGESASPVYPFTRLHVAPQPRALSPSMSAPTFTSLISSRLHPATFISA